MLKRGINGTHIHVSEKHLPKYLGEFEYRWNMRHVPHLMLDRLMHSFVALALCGSPSAMALRRRSKRVCQAHMDSLA